MRILELCKERGLTQKELAERVGLTPVGLSKSINGNPTKDTLQRIADALNVHISELFEKDMPNDNVIKCPNCGVELEVKKKEL